MGDPEHPDDVLVERGAVLIIVGCVFLYLAYLAEAYYQGTMGPAHRVAGIFIVYAVWTLTAGFLGLLERPLSTPMAGTAYSVGGWILAMAAARLLVREPVLGSVVVAVLVAPLVVLAQCYGVALGRGVERPAQEDTLVARTSQALAALVPGSPGRRH